MTTIIRTLAVCMMASLSFVVPACAQQATDHVLVIDGAEHQLKLGLETRLKLGDGREITVLLKRNETAVFSADGGSFEHPTAIAINSSVPEDGMVQHIGASALGTLMLLQVHDSIDLPALRESVYLKMVEEPKALGLAINRKDTERRLADGTLIKGVSITYKSTDDDVTIDIFTHQGKARAYLAMTMHDMITVPAEKAVIEKFWETLRLE
jgi:hypothetical protein